ncbi:PH domain-containing protein [Streptomyces albofaciens JCM 4342]|uniref:PH domain-containing protein n=1 Tax=Streptomyces albofaciens TaxID=66866 RepID=UPI00123C1D34|nr:PH domain-containing protein [Streptomyces albofaciens]KAA6223098.1 PH domain-containing protein [Streptomyces albofaciens JCM 4342]
MSAPASTPLPALPVTFRPARTRAVLYGVGIAQLAVLTVIAVLLPKLGPGERISFVFTGLLVLGVLLLLARPKVVAHQKGVTVVNLTTKRELAWAQVLRVNLRQGDPWVHLDLADGTSLPAMGIQPGIARDQAIRDARTLRALADSHGTGSQPNG